MHRNFELLITGEGSEPARLAALFEGESRLQVRLEPFPQPATGSRAQASDGLVLLLSADWQAELSAVAADPARPPLVVIGPGGETGAMRLAMQAGARDYLPAPAQDEELRAAVARMVAERRAQSHQGRGYVTAVINAKGGSGASTVAANLGHLLTAHCRRRTAVVDLDLQFGSLPLYFDMSGSEGILEALARVDSLDVVAVEGYMLRHPCGMHLLASSNARAVAPEAGDGNRLSRLLELLTSGYEQVVADLPRTLGANTLPVLAGADTVLLVVQQSVNHLRDARQLAGYLARQVGVTGERLWVVVNRFQRKLPIGLNEIEDALKPGRICALPNDYSRTASSIDLGMPLYETARGAAITRELIRLAELLPGAARPEQAHGQGLATRLLRWARV